MILHQANQRRVWFLPALQFMAFSAVFVVCVVAYPSVAAEHGVVSAVLMMLLFGGGLLYSVRSFIRVQAQPDGRVKVSRLLGRTQEFIGPQVKASIGVRGFYELKLISRGRSLELASRISTQRRNMKEGQRVAATLGLKLHPEVAAWLQADALL